MKLGLIVRADKTGLGYQTKAYYEHLNPHKTLLIDISNLNNNEQFYGWYQDVNISKGIPSTAFLDGWLNDIDVLLTAESPYNPQLYELCRSKGIRTASVYNYEFFDWFKYPDYPLPDLLIAPSMWHYDEIDQFSKEKGIKHVYLHHPVDREEFPFKLRETSKDIHIAGKPATHDRNGTWDYLQANPQGVVITQSEDLAKHIRWRYRHSRVYQDISSNAYMYQLGDILILPRRYGGNCLPLNEALSSGMPVVMPDLSPNNELLPKEWLVSARKTDAFTPRTQIDLYSVNVDELKSRIDWFKSLSPIEMREQSQIANKIAETISWKTMKTKWLKELEALCES